MNPSAHSSPIYSSQGMEAAYMSWDRRMDKKMWYIYAVEYYSAMKKGMKWCHLLQHGWT